MNTASSNSNEKTSMNNCNATQYTSHEQKILRNVKSGKDANVISHILFATTKYAAFICLAVIVYIIIFRNWMEQYPIMFGFVVASLMVYELKGREIIYYQIMRKQLKQIEAYQAKQEK